MCRLIANPKMSTYKCPKCETEFSLGTKFCEKCGCNLEVEFIETPTCPKCGKVFPTGTVFCNEHGVKLASPEQLIPRCGKCEKQYTDGTKYCPDCGGSVGVSMFLTNRDLASANDFTQTATPTVERFGVLAGTIGVILLSLFNWISVSIPLLGNLEISPFNIIGKVYQLENFIGIDTNESILGYVIIPAVLLTLSFVLLIISLLMKSHLKAKSTLAHIGFGLCATVITILIATSVYIYTVEGVWLLTIFPFLTLGTAIASMVFFVKQPTNTSQKNKKIIERGNQKISPNILLKYLYIVPSVILLVILVIDLWNMISFISAYDNVSLHWTTYPHFILMGILLIGILVFVFRSKPQAKWCALAYAILHFSLVCWNLVLRNKLARMYYDVEIQPLPILFYITMFFAVVLLAVALWNIFTNNKTR